MQLTSCFTKEITMSNEIKDQANNLNDLYEKAISNITNWNEYLPAMVKAKKNLDWIKNAMNSSPTVISSEMDETLMDYLNKASNDAMILLDIPEPNPSVSTFATTSGSAIPDAFVNFVKDLPYQFRDNQEVAEWAEITIVWGDNLKKEQNRSERVHQRLTQLKTNNLDELHKEAIDLCFKAQAARDLKPVGAAMVLTRLMEQFKGALISNCRLGKGNNYQRISENLADNSDLARAVVTNGQTTYDQINDELVHIRKRMKLSSGDRIVELLREIEDHIFIITDGLDPSKIGITFE